MNIRIEFDGGTSCNIPRLGFGNGYGSYKINDEPVYRCNFNQPMSCNAAEIRTLAHGIKAVRDRGWTITELDIIGDSQIALKWAAKLLRRQPYKVSQKTTPEFREAIERLRMAVEGVESFAVTWQPRSNSVATFGH